MIIDLRSGDCIQVLKEYEDNSIASIICDPPYGLNFMNKSWDQPADMLGVVAQDYESEGCEQRGAYQYGGSHTRGYFDNDNTKFRQWNEEWLREVFRILKPEGVIKAFSGTRTFHALSSAMENVGFRNISLEAWCYGSGFPKSHNVSRAINAEITTGGSAPKNFRKARMGDNYEPTGQKDYRKGRMFSSEIEQDKSETELCDQAKPYKGIGTCLKPSWEPIIVGRKPVL